MEVHVLDPLQEEAIAAGCDVTKRVVGITGEAGTGKTTILKMIYEKLKAAGYNPVLCSPTGKAAKRIFELTGIPAMTIHRLLEYTHPGDPDPKTGQPIGISKPRRDRTYPLDFDVVLADEYAMVPHELHRALFNAIPGGGLVRCFGDDNQLAPVEEEDEFKNVPSPFQKILLNKSGQFTVVRLTQVFRQGADSGILFNCGLILKGRYPTKNEQWSMDISDMALIKVKDYILNAADEGYDFTTPEHQLIVPQRVKSNLGSQKMNIMLQGVLRDFNDEHMKIDRKPWELGEGDEKGGKIRVFLGDKVIITSNLYDLGVFNGETGTVIELQHDTGEITIDFGDREQTIPPVLLVQNRHGGTSQIDPRKDIDLAYAITTHKSQGSEYKRGIYVLNKSNSWMISRRNFYTAASRFKEHFHLIADQKGLALALQKKD